MPYALREREAAGQAAQIRIARWCIARELLAELERVGEKDGYVLDELAENLLALNQPEAAQAYFALARAVTSDK